MCCSESCSAPGVQGAPCLVEGARVSEGHHAEVITPPKPPPSASKGTRCSEPSQGDPDSSPPWEAPSCVSPAQREGESYRHAWLMLRNPVPEPTVLGVHGLCDVDREAKEDRQTDGQTPGRLTRVGSLLGPSTEAVGPGVPLHGRELRLEFWFQNTPNIISCEQGESLPTLCLCEWGKALTLQTHRMVALEKRGRMKRGKQVFFQFYLKKKKKDKKRL